ncbi:tripeptidyl-peptidase [Achlya hypogyna]|uniref:subtilisin n=1 Tax=Achlya hypogyna TaxID=1202772 RepID=A0A1V9YMS7_ACHHY|nr:tripeptidyl-peptidase [Achlya hypogyna]
MSTSAFSSKRYLAVAPVTDDDRKLTWSIGLKAANPDALQSTFAEVTNPDHPNYGRYLSVEDADALTAPHPDALAEVHGWLGHRRTTFLASANVLVVESTVGEARELLDTEIAEFEHDTDGHRVLRASSPITIPSHLESKVSFVSLNQTPIRPRSQHPIKPLPPRHPINEEAGHIQATPQFIRQLYNVPSDAKVELATQAIASFLNESWSPADLSLFEKKFNLVEARMVQKGDGFNNNSAGTGEASLDVQYITAMAPNAETTVWSINDSKNYGDADCWISDWANQVLSDPNPSLVHSISYGDEEANMVPGGLDALKHTDELFQKFAVRGLTILIASGDNGVSSTGCSVSAPEWPASSPYVLSVGATQIGTDGKSEVVCSAATGGTITSGGGFSNYYPTPSWQAKAVLSYLAGPNVPKQVGYFNPKGRGYPDVTAIGDFFPVFVQGDLGGYCGTSASTPTTAGLITLWNELRLQKGLPSVGFINPLLYKIGGESPSAFHDIVVGNNGAGVADQHGNYSFCPLNFAAGPGWDAASGLGSPVFDKLATLILNNGSVIGCN